jgi:polyisoprenoid-binding protein YceI
VTVEADVGSFEVREGTGGVKPLTDTDRADIKNTLRGKILNTRQHPVITFVSSKVSGTAESFRIDGDLTIVGVTQPVTVEGQLTAGKPHRTTTYRERSPSQACVSSGRAYRRKGALHTRIAPPAAAH